jgi:hypothetical protein
MELGLRFYPPSYGLVAVDEDRAAEIAAGYGCTVGASATRRVGRCHPRLGGRFGWLVACVGIGSVYLEPGLKVQRFPGTSTCVRYLLLG